MACCGMCDVLKARLAPDFLEMLDKDCRTERLEQNLVGCMTARQMAQATLDVSHGDGGELRWGKDGSRPSAHSLCSSATLAINSFACWIGHEAELELAGRAGFNFRLNFEGRFPTWPDKKWGHPNLDVVAGFDGGIVAVESKLKEPCEGSKAADVDAYVEVVKDPRRCHPSWRALFDDLLKEKGRGRQRRFKRLDAAQLMKHYLGLKTKYSNGGATLLYLFWEPLDGDDVAWAVRHRNELKDFNDAVNDPQIPFAVATYNSRANDALWGEPLWSQWEKLGEPWLDACVAELRRRYDVTSK